MDTLHIVYLCIFWWSLQFASGAGNNVVSPACTLTEQSCEFYLTLSAQRTMVHTQETSIYSMFDGRVTYYSNGSVSVRDRRQCGNQRLLSDQEATTVPSGDGSFKLAYLFNRSLPGPAIVVYKYQEIIVHVKNALINEGTSVHWHGLTQHNTPWMDGVEMLSQCTINPGETFTYRFLADRPGTFWYHTHTSVQRTMGAYGPLIILDRNREEQNKRREKDPLPFMDKEFYLMVSDWFGNTSSDIAEMIYYKAFGYLGGWEIRTSECFNSTKAPDGMDAGVVPFQSGLINGKGYYYVSANGDPVNPNIPLEKFTVKKGKRYRFRMIGTAMTFLFRISIDNHRLNIIAMDSNDVTTKEVDYIIISSGERYDFWIEATDPDDTGSYWIRAETLEMYNDQYDTITPNHVEAILQYSTHETSKLPVSKPNQCTKDNPCIALNCPFKWYGVNPNITCLSVSELHNAERGGDSVESKKGVEARGSYLEPPVLVEHFLNYHAMLKLQHKSTGGMWAMSINGKRNELPHLPLQVYPDTESEQRKLCRCPADVFCPCTHMVDIPLGSIVQLVLFVTVKNPAGVWDGTPHNVHLHGYRFKLLRIGFPAYDNETSFVMEHSTDIKCIGEFCNKATWTNSSWLGGNVPVHRDSREPLKDTILIPVGGYAVIQFTADNPGYWYMHCHTEFHNEEGMSMVFKVGNTSEMAPAPDHMLQCGNPDWTDVVVNKRKSNKLFRRDQTENHSCASLVFLYKTITLVLIAIVLLLLAADVYICCKKNHPKAAGYTRLSTS